MSETRLIVACMAVVVALFAMMASYGTRRITRGMALDTAGELTELLAVWARGPIERRQWADLNNLASMHSANAGLRFVTFLILDDSPSSSQPTDDTRTVQFVSSIEHRIAQRTDLPDWAVLQAPIRSDRADCPDPSGCVVGSVVLALEPRHLELLITRAQYWIVTASALLVSILLVLSLMLWKRTRRSVEQLAAQASRLLGKDWHDAAKGTGESAVGKVGAALGTLADELANYKHQLDDLHTQIEKRVSERTELLRDLASRDPLTGLRNRRFFKETLEDRFEEARRYQDALSLAVIDVDDFKRINDQHGHVTGDEVLIALATTMNSELRSADVGARFGGDEFVVLMPQTRIADASNVIERVRAKFEESCRRQFDGMRVTLSIGVAAIDQNTECSTDFFSTADRAMYRAKKQNKEPQLPQPVSHDPATSTNQPGF